jgi:peptide/nickel transport system substrate-binding protein
MNRGLRRAAFVLIVSLILLGSIGVGSASTQLRFAIHDNEGTLNPYTYYTGYPGHNLLLMVFDALMHMDAEGIPQPWLAKSVDVTEGGKVWTVKLEEDAKWHDGQPVTSDDVRFSYEYVTTTEGNHGRWSGPAKSVEKIDTPDAHTVIFTLKNPNPSFSIRPLADQPIFPKHIWSDVTEPGEFLNSIGSGPYKLVEYTPDKFYRLEAIADYYKGTPKVDAILLEIIKDANTMFTALQASQVDGVSRALQPELVTQFQATGLQTVTGPSFGSTIVNFNVEREPFSHKEFRQAVDFAINSPKLVETLLLGQGTVANNGFVHPDLPWANPDLKPNYDPDRARQLLESAGFKDTNSDGFVQKPDGSPINVQLLAASNNPIRVRAAELIAVDMKAVGINTTVRVQESSTVIDMVWKDFDVSQPRTYDMVMFGWSAPVMADPGRLRDLVHSDTAKGTLNLMGYRNPAADELGDALAKEADLDRRFELTRELQALIAEDVPLISLWFPTDTYAFNAKVYDGWVYTNGQGIVSKISFVSAASPAPKPAEEAKAPEAPKAPEQRVAQEATTTRNTGLIWFAGLAALGLGALIFTRFRGKAS